MYGDHVHGRQTLIARRLLERGVRVVNSARRRPAVGSPRQHRIQHSQEHSEIDGPIAALIADLKQRGLLKNTPYPLGRRIRSHALPVELGAEGKSKLGRDHNHWGFSVWMAGGGIRGGQAYGATDDFGFRAVKTHSVHDLHATMLHCLGFDHERLTYGHAGRDFRLTDVSGEVIREIVT